MTDLFRSPQKNPISSRNTGKFYNATVHLAQRLTNGAIWHDGRCTWTGDDVDWVEDDWKVVHQTMDPYLYSGNAGIARFLALFWQLNGDDSTRKTAVGAVRYAVDFLAKKQSEEEPLGLYDGLTGIAMVASDVGTRLQEPELLEAGSQLSRELCEKINSGNLSDMTDITSGYAGIMLGLMQLASLTGNHDLYSPCQILADKLLLQAHHTPYGCYWTQISHSDSRTGLCGYGHGASGIAHALLEYYQVSGTNKYLEAARDTMRYERSWFNPHKSNWPDIRNLSSEQGSLRDQEMGYSVYWCHGAAGVGLARLRAYQLTGEKTFLAESSAALQAATRHARELLTRANASRRLSVDANLSVCHGLGSIIDLFIYASQVLGDEEFLRRARDIGSFGLRISTDKREYWRCGISGGKETPGLMIGLTGIAYNFLRLYSPEEYAPAGMEICM